MNVMNPAAKWVITWVGALSAIAVIGAIVLLAAGHPVADATPLITLGGSGLTGLVALLASTKVSADKPAEVTVTNDTDEPVPTEPVTKKERPKK